ncbi:MAG: hypothetical protein R3C19_08110 [Planctomycetaceae bacterium]
MAASCRLAAILLSAVVLIAATSAAIAQPADDDSILPFDSGDRVVVVDDESGRETLLTGRVEDLEGNRLTFRSNRDGAIQVLRIPDVMRIEFAKSADFEAGLRLMQQGDHASASKILTTALKSEQQPWVRREIRAALARNSIRLRQRRDAVEQIRVIFDEDPKTRHLGLLPLVWEERLSPDQRLSVDAAWLTSDSAVERLAAGSVFLDNEQHSALAEKVLEDLKRHRSGGISDLAETQLWRLRLRDLSRSGVADVRGFQRRINVLPTELRPGPQYLLGKALAALHNHDDASRAFLWMPLMSPVDPDLTQKSLAEAISHLQQSGRLDEAALLSAEGVR